MMDKNANKELWNYKFDGQTITFRLSKGQINKTEVTENFDGWKPNFVNLPIVFNDVCLDDVTFSVENVPELLIGGSFVEIAHKQFEGGFSGSFAVALLHFDLSPFDGWAVQLCDGRITGFIVFHVHKSKQRTKNVIFLGCQFVKCHLTNQLTQNF